MTRGGTRLCGWRRTSAASRSPSGCWRSSSADAQRCSHQGRHENGQDEAGREASGPARSASPGPVARPRSSCHEPDRVGGKAGIGDVAEEEVPALPVHQTQHQQVHQHGEDERTGASGLGPDHDVERAKDREDAEGQHGERRAQRVRQRRRQVPDVLHRERDRLPPDDLGHRAEARPRVVRRHRDHAVARRRRWPS